MRDGTDVVGAAGGAAATRRFVVGEADTARALGSGDLDVLGTPRLLAWCEAATCDAVAPLLAEGQTSVGVHVELDHLAATAVGGDVQVVAVVVGVEGRRVELSVEATDGGDVVIGAGRIVRQVVDRQRFLERLPST